MASVIATPLPETALLNTYRQDGYFTDCYTTTVPFAVSHSDVVFSFYTSPLFKMERILLHYLARCPADDRDAKALAEGRAESFSAWIVEARAENQLLLSDFRHRTRSWLMVEPQASQTRLYFGSAVVPVANPRTGKKSMGWLFEALSGFHRLYSVLLLKAAVRQLRRRH